MDNASQNFVAIVRDLVQQELSKRGGVVLCQIVEKKDDTHYDLTVVPDQDNIIHNVTNMTSFELFVGDYVYIYKINGQLNNAFICYKVIPYIAPSVNSGSGISEASRAAMSFILNKNKVNANRPVSFFIAEINTNEANISFLTYESTFTQARPYYQESYNKSYYMIGTKSSPVQIGEFVFNNTSIQVFDTSFTVRNGFTLNKLTGKVASTVTSFSLTATAYDANNNVIAQETKTIDAVSSGTDPEDVSEISFSLVPSAGSVIKKIKLTSNETGHRFNMFTLALTYKKIG